jgi:arylsulfatase A-like enzyme
VVIVVVDTLRADHMSTYGYARPTTPALDRLAGESVVFERAFTVMSHTLPAHISLVTGVHPATHQVLSNGWTYEGRWPTLAERLAERGWATGGFVSGFPLVPKSGFDRGFEEYRDVKVPGRERRGLKIDGELTTARALRWMRAQGERPFFMLVHYFDTHQPYRSPQEGSFELPIDGALAARMKEAGSAGLSVEDVSHVPLVLDRKELTLAEAVNAYDNLIRRVDAMIEEIRAELERAKLLDDTLFIVTSDHGEGLGQRSYFSHGLYLYEEQLRIPLIVRAPRWAAWKPGRIGAVVSLLDIVPTVLEICDVPADETLHGVSLSGLARDEEPGPRALVAQRRRFPKRTRERRGDRFTASTPLHALRGDSALKYLRSGDGVEELYDLEADPWERHNLAAERPEDAARLRAAMEGLLARSSSTEEITEPELDPETEEALRALGYVQ